MQVRSLQHSHLTHRYLVQTRRGRALRLSLFALAMTAAGSIVIGGWPARATHADARYLMELPRVELEPVVIRPTLADREALRDARHR